MIVRACVSSNFGDALNTELIRLITSEKPQLVNNSFKNPDNEDIYMAIGSVLGWADRNTIVWGAGKMSDTDATMFKEAPKKICAVRGPLTRDEIIKRGFDCPEVYGDPALLMPRFFDPRVEKKYSVSVIPHAIDRVLIPEIKKDLKFDAHFIDVTQNVYDFIREIKQSEFIISSALHGCIMAHAYGIPYEHVLFSTKVLGNGFKFRDFEASKELIDLDKLMKVCPFRKDTYEKETSEENR